MTGNSMAGRAPHERLQPSLLDRLRDDAPDQKTESRERRVLTMAQLRACVLRDVRWLLNASTLDTVQDLEPYPEVRRSVLNYGMPDLAGRVVSDLDGPALEKELKRIVQDFEPRIKRKTLKVNVIIAQDESSYRAVRFEIQGELWAEAAQMYLYLKTEVDLETGTIRVSDAGERGSG